MPGTNKMRLFSCVALIVGACIGSAIFSLSGFTIYYAGPAAIISWIAAAIIFGFYGIVVAELALIYPHSGGIYIFPRRASGGNRGRVLGFVSGWGYIISTIIAVAFSAIYTGLFLNFAFPEIPSGALTSVITLLFAFLLVFIETKRSQDIQNVLVVALSAVLILFCLLAYFGGDFHSESFDNFFNQGAKGSTGFITSIPLALVAYGGCVSIAFLASDVKNPKRNIPLSLGLGLGFVALVYVLSVGAIVGSLPEGSMSDPELRFIPMFAATYPGGGLHKFTWLVKVIAVGGAMALFTSIIVMMRVNIRTVQAMSTEGLLPKYSVAAISIISLLVSTFTNWAELLISLGAILNIVSMAITCYALIVTIKKRNHKWGYALLPAGVAVLLFICYLPEVISGDFSLWIFTAGVYLSGFLFHHFYSRKKSIRISGVVVHGKGHGHLHDMPTANLQPYPGEVLPRHGVWSTYAYVDGKRYNAMTHIGLRPSDDDSPEITVETLILDGFNSDIYAHELTLEFREFVRETIKFQNLDQLKEQIASDSSSLGSDGIA